MNNNYEIIRTILENEFQRIIECKNSGGEIFYNNVITHEGVINFINIERLNSLHSNIIDCYKTHDRLYIMTEPLKIQKVKDYVSSRDLTLKQQFMLSKNVIELSSDIYDLKDVMQQKILDYDNLYIDDNGQVVVDCNLVFDQEYDIPENETFKKLANILHFIFAKNEIEDYNISELVPPDMLKIIVRCLTKEYFTPNDTLKELKNSPIYNMINSGLDDKNYAKFENSKSNKIIIPINISDDENIAYDDLDTKNIFDIYLNDSSDDDKDKDSNINKGYKNNKSNKNIFIAIACILLFLIIGNFFINKNRDSKIVYSNNADLINTSSNENKDNLKNNQTNETVNDTDIENVKDSTNKFLNEDILKKINYTGVVAGYDNEIYMEGKQSLLINNETEDKIKALFAVVDFNNDDNSYMLKKQIGVAFKTKSKSDATALIILEAYKDEKLSSTFHTTIKVYDDIWSPVLVPINVTNADSLCIYIEYKGKNKIWIDSLSIDVIK